MTAPRRSPFGQLLRRHRLAAGLSQEDLAEQAGLSVRGISDLERGLRASPRPETVRMLADALALEETERAALFAAAWPDVDDAGPAPPASMTPASPAPVSPGSPPARPPLPLAPVPVPPTRLVGREAEVAQVCALLGRDEVRLLTVTGPGGVGKTRLALAVAQALGADFPDGIAFVELAPVRQPELVVTAIAAGLGVRETGDVPLVRVIRNELRERALLLVLDNFEHVLPAALLVAELMAAAPGLKVLATSRERLHLRGERELPLDPLALPAPVEGEQPQPLAGLAGVAAVRLFVERAEEARLDFALTTENAAAVVELCRRLDGLPLAIELAAARIRMLPPDALLARLAVRFSALTDGPRDLPDRQRTLRAAIDWSHDLLSPAEQAFFRRLAVFAGGWDLAAAEAVAGGASDGGRGTDPLSHDPGPVSHVPVFAMLASLMDKSLIRQTFGGAGRDGEPRFGLLETIREYALERLDESGERAEIERRHATHYVALAEEAWPHLVGTDQARWFGRLDREHDNLRAVLGWALADGDAELGLRLAGRLWWYWSVRGYYGEGRSWLDRLLAADRGAPAAVRAQALHGAGGLAQNNGDVARAAELLDEALVLRRRIGDKRGVAATAGNLSNTMRLLGDLDRARSLHEESLALYQELGDLRGVSVALTGLGAVARDQGDFDQALVYYEESLVLARQAGDPQHTMIALACVGRTAHLLGDDERATSLVTECLELARSLGVKRSVAMALNDLGIFAHARGELSRARALIAEALTVARELEDTLGMADCLNGLGSVARDGGDHVDAAACYAESLGLYRQVGHTQGVAAVLDEVAVLALRRDEPARAVRLFTAADALRRAEGLAATWTPAERASRRASIAKARTGLGEVGFLAAQEEGAGLAVAEAIAEALAAMPRQGTEKVDPVRPMPASPATSRTEPGG